MEDLKALARVKRASSKRGRARHSSKHHAHVSSGTSESAASERAAPIDETLPSNWERYADGGGSDEDTGIPAPSGEVRPKSKGADYRELLSPMHRSFLKIYQLRRGKLRTMRCASCPSCRKLACLLSLDLEVVEKSLASLHIADRLMVEKELFIDETDFQEPAQPDVYATDRSTETQYVDDGKRSHHHESVGVAGPAVRAEEEQSDFSLSVPGISEAVSSRTDVGGSVSAPSDISTVRSSDEILGWRDHMPSGRDGLTPIKEDKGLRESEGQSGPSQRFVPASAEADLDELLDMIDSQVFQASSNSVSSWEGREVSIPPDTRSPDTRAEKSSGASKLDTDNSFRKWVDVLPDFGQEKSVLQRDKEVKNVDPLTLDDDFDTWLDSI